MADPLDFLNDFRVGNTNVQKTEKRGNGRNFIVDSFKDNFRELTGMTTDEFMDAQKRQKDVTAKSRGNVKFDNSYREWDKYNSEHGLSSNFADTLKDAIGYYQKEFKVTPRATISSAWEDMPYGVEGMAFDKPNDEGNFAVNLRNLRDHNEEEAIDTASDAESRGWWAKGYGGNLSGVPTHELGHVLTFQLFPNYESVAKLYKDSLKDMGIDYDPNNRRDVLKAAKKAKEISGYAAASNVRPPYAPWNDEYETIAEALADYYYNRDNAADFSKAIVKRMKSKGATYGLEQVGGIGGKNETFKQNLRRYNVLQ